MAVERVQELSSRHSGWYQLAVHRADHCRFVSGNLNWVLIVYFINVVCIAANWLVYFRNRRLDAQRSTEVVMEEESFVVVA